MRIAAGVVLSCMVVAAFSGPALGQGGPKPEKVAELRMALRDLLVEHIHWSRTLVLATRAGQPGMARVAESQALANARALGEAVGSFYGPQAGQKFAGLFTAHNRAVKEYMEAAFAGSGARKKVATDRAVRNAQEIDAFLSSANPHLPKGAVLNLLTAHWAHHVAAIDAAARRDWDQEARVWHDMRKHILTVADALAEAVAKQFAERLR